MHHTKPVRSLAKTVTWRVTATTTTIIIAWAITGSAEVGLAIGGIEAVAKMILYYLHERVWDKAEFGRIQA